MAWAMRMPRPSSPSVPTLKVPRARGGQCWRSMSSLKMKPPAVRTTPASGPQRHRLAEALRLARRRRGPSSTTRRSTRVSAETRGPGVGRRGRQVLHEQPPGRALRLGQVAPRRRAGDLVERVGVLAARVHEALGAVGRHGGVGAEASGRRGRPGPPASRSGPGSRRSSGRSSARRDRARRPPSCSGTCRRGCPRSRRPVWIGVPPPEVHDALGQRGGSAGPAGPLGDQHLGAGLGRGEGRGRPGGAEADDDHVGRRRPSA